MDSEDELARIAAYRFFSTMGAPADDQDSIIYIEDVCKVFVEPTEADFKGCYRDVQWLPSSPSQADPFYSFPKSTTELAALRVKISKAIMLSTQRMDKARFSCGAHDFSQAARHAISFAFRQLTSERYYGVGHHWEAVVRQYYAGRWPVGFCKNRWVVI